MFETAELGQKATKKEYKRRAPLLRAALLEAQDRLARLASEHPREGFPALVLLAGVDGAGKGETLNLLNEWMDPHLIETHAYGEPSQDERERPDYWRFWRDLPPKGQLSLVQSAWYSRPLLRRVEGWSDDELASALDDIAAFERTLTDDGALVLKFWLHLDKQGQERRFQALEADPLLSWRVTPKDWENWRRYERFVSAAERIISHTSRQRAPWHIVDGGDERYRSLRVGELLLGALEERLEKAEQAAKRGDRRKRFSSSSPALDLTILSRVDLSAKIPKAAYRPMLEGYQGTLNRLHREARERGLTTLLVFEGWDAGGKGGAIRRIVAALDARWVRVHGIAAPTDEERARHYLWRFWRRLPRAGHVAIFDRSWYGRVLVERVEGLAAPEEWRRAYAEINAFEHALVEGGTALLKFWIHISKDEQKRRFEARREVSYKRWKLTDEDYRNRKRWKDYELAVHDMVERTSTEHAPWVLVEGNDKRFARIKILESVCQRLQSALDVPAPAEVRPLRGLGRT